MISSISVIKFQLASTVKKKKKKALNLQERKSKSTQNEDSSNHKKSLKAIS